MEWAKKPMNNKINAAKMTGRMTCGRSYHRERGTSIRGRPELSMAIQHIRGEINRRGALAKDEVSL